MATWTPATRAQVDRDVRPAAESTLHAGDEAPPLEIEKWLGGEGGDALPKDRVGIVVFVASWSEASERALTWLAGRSRVYAKDDIGVVAVFGQDAAGAGFFGKPETELTASAFIQRHAIGSIRCAFDQRWRSRSAWLSAAGMKTLPAAFIVDTHGKIAWLGNPLWPPGEMEDALAQIKAGVFGVVERRALRTKWEGVLRELKGLDNTLTAARNTGRHDIAVATLERLEKLDALSRGYYKVARFEIVYLENLDSEAAFTIARGALETDGDNAQMLNDISWTILTGEGAKVRDLPLSQKLAERAVEASEGKNPHYLDTLARAHADQGHLDEAIKQQKKAVDLAGDASEREDLLSTLQEYLRKREGR
ncbi:MAG: hypothetical protein IT432_05445 [Phycisphaerales bacterium]|nr:hypothetical protein [Phycisphaerales bacterium]